MMQKAEQVTLSTKDYQDFRTYLEKMCGIVLGDNKQYLVTSRLNKLLNEHKLASLGELLTMLNKNQSRVLTNKIVEAMTTNETS